MITLDELVGARFRGLAARSHVMKQNALTNTCAKSTERRILRSTFSHTSCAHVSAATTVSAVQRDAIPRTNHGMNDQRHLGDSVREIAIVCALKANTGVANVRACACGSLVPDGITRITHAGLYFAARERGYAWTLSSTRTGSSPASNTTATAPRSSCTTVSGCVGARSSSSCHPHASASATASCAPGTCNVSKSPSWVIQPSTYPDRVAVCMCAPGRGPRSHP